MIRSDEEEEIRPNKALKRLGKLVGKTVTVFFKHGEQSETGILDSYNYLYDAPFIVLKDEYGLFKVINFRKIFMIQEKWDEQT